jgi:hypothetical protein
VIYSSIALLLISSRRKTLTSIEGPRNDRIVILCSCEACKQKASHVSSFLGFYRKDSDGFYRETNLIKFPLSKEIQFDNGEIELLREFLLEKFSANRYDVLLVGFEGCLYFGQNRVGMEGSHVDLLSVFIDRIQVMLENKTVKVRFLYGIPSHQGSFVDFKEIQKKGK